MSYAIAKKQKGNTFKEIKAITNLKSHISDKLTINVSEHKHQRSLFHIILSIPAMYSLIGHNYKERKVLLLIEFIIK